MHRNVQIGKFLLNTFKVIEFCHIIYFVIYHVGYPGQNTGQPPQRPPHMYNMVNIIYVCY